MCTFWAWKWKGLLKILSLSIAVHNRVYLTCSPVVCFSYGTRNSLSMLSLQVRMSQLQISYSRCVKTETKNRTPLLNIEGMRTSVVGPKVEMALSDHLLQNINTKRKYRQKHIRHSLIQAVREGWQCRILFRTITCRTRQRFGGFEW